MLFARIGDNTAAKAKQAALLTNLGICGVTEIFLLQEK